MSYLQSVLFSKDMYNKSYANKWLKRNKYIPIKKVDETKNYYRYRISEPNYKYYRIIDFDIGIKAVLGFNK